MNGLPLSFASLRKANVARDREWNTSAERLRLTYRGNELAGEAGEACNALKKLERESLGLKGSRATAGDVAAELADVVICADLIAMDLGIDMGLALSDRFNATSTEHGFATRLGETADIAGLIVEEACRAGADQDALVNLAHAVTGSLALVIATASADEPALIETNLANICISLRETTLGIAGAVSGLPALAADAGQEVAA